MKNVDGGGDVDVLVACELAHLIYFENPGRDSRCAEWRRVIIPITTNRGSYIRVFAADLDGDGDLDISSGAYSRGPRDRDGPLVTVDDPLGRITWLENPGDGSVPYDGVIWLEQVRQAEPHPVFEQACAIDSQQMPPPGAENQETAENEIDSRFPGMIR